LRCGLRCGNASGCPAFCPRGDFLRESDPKLATLGSGGGSMATRAVRGGRGSVASPNPRHADTEPPRPRCPPSPTTRSVSASTVPNSRGAPIPRGAASRSPLRASTRSSPIPRAGRRASRRCARWGSTPSQSVRPGPCTSRSRGGSTSRSRAISVVSCARRVRRGFWESSASDRSSAAGSPRAGFPAGWARYPGSACASPIPSSPTACRRSGVGCSRRSCRSRRPRRGRPRSRGPSSPSRSRTTGVRSTPRSATPTSAP